MMKDIELRRMLMAKCTDSMRTGMKSSLMRREMSGLSIETDIQYSVIFMGESVCSTKKVIRS